MAERITAPSYNQDLDREEASLRPKYLKDFLGQEKLKENISVFIQADRKSVV